MQQFIQSRRFVTETIRFGLQRDEGRVADVVVDDRIENTILLRKGILMRGYIWSFFFSL